MYRYKLKSLGASSFQYGPCDVCDEHVSEVFIQIEERQYWIPGLVEGNWTRWQCFDHFGHKECLESKQREPKELHE